MTVQEELSVLLKHKGIGPSGSKSLKQEDIARLRVLLLDQSCAKVSKATILTALLTLPPNDAEKEYLHFLKQNFRSEIDEDLWGFFDDAYADAKQRSINRVIAHESLAFDEASELLAELFDAAPEFQLAAFLEAERLKRETYDENLAFLQVMQAQITPVYADIPLLIEFGDSYDGCNRNPSLNLFVACILAAAGYPCLVQGAEWHAPKEGLTHHAILKKGGKNPYVSVEEAAAQLADPSIGWAYLDQSVVDPKVHAMRQMRREMVKRPFLATFEKMLQPIRAQKNYLLTQYTHKHYKLEIAKLVQNHCSFEAALHIKGIEGTSMINPTDTEAVFITPSEVKELTLNGTHWGFSQPLKKLEKASPWYVHAIGMSLINTGDHDYSEFITYQCVAILHHLLGVDPKTAVYEVQQAIASGEALSRWERLP